jgi:hypothetical protein
MSAATLESHDYSHLIGSDLEVGDAENQSFATYLPRAGKVVRQIALDDWGTDWLVLQLHEPFEYQLGSLDTGFRVSAITHFVVRSRLLGHPIGAQRTSVFLLLDADHLLDTKQQFRSTDFIHISWAMIPPYDHATKRLTRR